MTADPNRFERAREAFLEGVRHHEGGRLDAAEACFLQARDLLPGRASTLINLAATRLALGRAAEAVADLAPLVAAEPAHREALALLARAHEALGDPVAELAALQAMDASGAAGAGEAGIAYRRGMLLLRLERAGEAMHAFEAAIARDPGHAAAWQQRGSLLREAGRREEAAHCFRQALAHGADPELNRWYLAAVTAADAAAAAPARYVQALFDGYADGFEQHLVNDLGYRAHEAVVALLPPGRPYADALDLGCGTGLCLAALGARVGRATGIDLSAGMLAQARASGRYARLAQADLVAWLQTTDERHDLVLAADVFIYVGDLRPVFAGVRRVLRPGGDFVFSVEAAPAGGEFELAGHLRYRHGEAALRRWAAEAGLAVADVRRGVLRAEQQRPVEGLLLRLTLSSAPAG